MLSQSGIKEYEIFLKPLSEPDFLEFPINKNSVSLIADDGTSLSAMLADKLAKRGFKVVVIKFPEFVVSESANFSENINVIRLKELSEETLKTTLASISNTYGNIDAFIHINPVFQNEKSDLFIEEEKIILKYIFLIAKHLKHSLNAALTGRGSFITVSRIDGRLGLSGRKNYGIITGGLLGLVKTLNLEWNKVFCRGIDISPEINVEKAAEAVFNELHDPNTSTAEIGYNLDGRFSLEAVWDADAKEPDIKTSEITSSSLFLVSGGAKGITGECVKKLAENFKCGFLLLGRTSPSPEPEWAKGIDDETDLKKKIIERLISEGEKPSPSAVSKAVKNIISCREIAETLKAIDKTGGRARYISVDVTDKKALEEKISEAEKDLGKITGIIHGAGILADKLIEKKSEEEIEAVYAAKIEGLKALLKSVEPNNLSHLVLFSSAAGFYGNIGQSDYAAANEILNKLAYRFKEKYPLCHVVSFNWGPWDGGMVRPELRRVFKERNISVIPVPVGVRIFLNRLINDNNGHIQILVGEPFIEPYKESDPELKTHIIRRKLKSDANPFLKDHMIGDYPVLPTVCGSVWIANVAEELCHGYKFFSCNDFKVLKGIVFDDALPEEFFLEIKETEKILNEYVDIKGTIWSGTADKKPRYHYTGDFRLVSEIPDIPVYKNFDASIDEAISGHNPYEERSLFHGTVFRGIKRILNISDKKLTMECVMPNIEETVYGQFPPKAFNPISADIQFQCMLIWLRHFYGVSGLPLSCKKGEHYSHIPKGEKFYVSMETRSINDTKFIADIISHDIDGNIYSRALGSEFSLSKDLNEILFLPSKKEELKDIIPFWRNYLKTEEWLGETLFKGLFRRFVGKLMLEDKEDFEKFKGKPKLYLANHQAAIESLLFSFSLSSSGESMIHAVAKIEHKKTWINELLHRLYSHPKINDPDLSFYFNRKNRASMLDLISKIKRVIKETGHSLLVHIEGTRSLSCRDEVSVISSVFLDMSIDLNIPVIPIGFTGGLPASKLDKRIEFPIGYTYQDYRLGKAILPDTLKQLTNNERKKLVLEKLNNLCRNIEPNPKDPYFKREVELWMKEKRVPEVKAVIYKVLEETAAPGSSAYSFIKSIRDGNIKNLSDNEEGRWLAELGSWIFE